MKKVILFFLWIFPFFLSGEEYNFFIDMRDRKLATFNDAVTLMRYVFAESVPNPDFRENIVWAAEKKLFQVSIPIQENTVNPVITREEFCSWLCKLFELGGKPLPRNKNAAYKRCLTLGIILPGRGARDSFTGPELLDTFSYFDSYVRHFNIKKRYAILPLFDTKYDDLPEWRKKLYRELDLQQQEEKNLQKEVEQQTPESEKEVTDDIDWKYID